MLMDYALVLVAYLVGSINTSIVLTRLLKLEDPRQHGSHNPGATNMMRTNSKCYGLLALLGDGAKGTLATACLPTLTDTTWLIPACILAVFLGHLYPLYHRFQGGKGVATSLGILLGLDVYLALMALALWGIALLITRWVSLASMISALGAALLAIKLQPPSIACALIIMALLLINKHADNIKRLLSGSETKI